MNKLMGRLFFFGLIAMFVFNGCKNDSNVNDATTENGVVKPLFSALSSEQTGIDFSNDLNPSLQNNILEYLYYYNGGGVAVGDINNDGLEDVMLTANESPDKLYINKGSLKFEEVSENLGLEFDNTWSSGVAIDDVNGDGLMDIYICKVSPLSATKTHNQLFIQSASGQFSEQSTKFGLDFSGYSTQASFFDYDLDGDLDMYLLNHSVHSIRSYGKAEKRNETDDLAGDRLYENKLNEPAGKFVDITKSAGIYSSALGYGLSVSTADLNNDGWADIYVANDFHENDYIYLNNKNKTFSESIGEVLNHSSKFSMGVDVADMNGDGLADIFTTDMLPNDGKVALRSGGEDTDQVFNIRKDFGFEDQYARNHFQIQSPDHHFYDVALITNTYATDWSWSVLLQDFDNNGSNDIFIANGIVKRPNDLDYINFLNQQDAVSREIIDEEKLKQLLEIMPSQKLNNYLFLQSDSLNFANLSNSKVGNPSFSNGAAYADLDLDGDLDLVINNINEEASILENNGPNGTSGVHYISFGFHQSEGLNYLKGTKVQVYHNGQMIEKEYVTTRGYQSSSTHYLHFGLGEKVDIDSIVVLWADQMRQILTNYKIDTHQTLEKEEGLSKYVQKEAVELENLIEILPIIHRENKFYDYNQDKLIPELISREGPAVVYEDFNLDGLPDLYFGGGRFQEPKLFFTNKDGSLKSIDNLDFKKDAKYEDVDAVAFDFDQDGDLDLYVMSGGNDDKELDKQLQDRIYLNDGKGNLKRLPISLPHTNGGSVSAGDFDGDGFPDLFVGARSIPGSYGLSPFSFILRNNSGLGLELVKKERYGMITDSEWADMDNDGDTDLVICGDWMNITILENTGSGDFEINAQKFGLENSSGLWNTLLLHDINEDGRLDILAGNTGTNFKWKASIANPVIMDVVDLDKNGQTEPLIFHHYFGHYMPYMSLDKLASQAPLIKKQFLKYADYAEVDDISDFNEIDESLIVERKRITELRSMLYLSGNDKYTGIPLPFEAQLSTIQDFEMGDNNEILFVGNHHEYLTELGKNSSNSGGRLVNFRKDLNRFERYESLSLPHDINPREILRFRDKDYLVVCNDDQQYILKGK